jgi:hypothetical protein
MTLENSTSGLAVVKSARDLEINLRKDWNVSEMAPNGLKDKGLNSKGADSHRAPY